MLAKLWHWLTVTDNPFDLYGFWPSFMWTIAMLVVGFAFFLLETAGIKRFHEMIPLTWYWRCAPKWIWFIIGGLIVWHFAFNVTKVK